MSWDQAADVLAATCLLVGSGLTLAAGVGVLRFPDLLSRIHAGAKPQVLGVLIALAGLALRLRSLALGATLALIALFQLFGAPVTFHMVARAGYRTGKIQPETLVLDELTTDLEASRSEGDQSP